MSSYKSVSFVKKISFYRHTFFCFLSRKIINEGTRARAIPNVAETAAERVAPSGDRIGFMTTHDTAYNNREGSAVFICDNDNSGLTMAKIKVSATADVTADPIIVQSAAPFMPKLWVKYGQSAILTIAAINNETVGIQSRPCEWAIAEHACVTAEKNAEPAPITSKNAPVSNSDESRLR